MFNEPHNTAKVCIVDGGSGSVLDQYVNQVTIMLYCAIISQSIDTVKIVAVAHMIKDTQNVCRHVAAIVYPEAESFTNSPTFTRETLDDYKTICR